MSVTILDMPQRSPEWFAARLGRVTGSTVNDMLATVKTGEAAARRNLRVRLVLERLTGQSAEDPYTTNGDMERGRELEPDARALYEAQTGNLLLTPGFYSHNELLAGCSPDGVTLDGTGVVSFKCPRAANHLEFIRARAIPADYARQVLHETWLIGPEWADVVSYCPQFPEPLRLHVRRAVFTAEQIEAHEVAVKAFLAECDLELGALKTMTKTPDVFAEAVR